MPAWDDLIASIARGGVQWLDRQRRQTVGGNLSVPGLSAPAEIFRDEWGIPHVYAANQHDLFFAQGFIHAQDRLFQMELNRRTAQGRLSELFGPLALDTDRASLTFGFNRLGRADWQQAGDELRLAVQAYSDGVNAYLVHPQRKMPVEFTLLGYTPHPWKPEDCTAFGRVMMWQLSHAWYGEVIRAQLIQAVGAEHAADWEIHYPQGNPATLPQGVEFHPLPGDAGAPLTGGPFLKRGLGSNAWVVSGGKSDTGQPYLCNDMHLQLGQPSIWYEMHLHAGNYHASGVTLPAAPAVLVGHNERIAWGMTLAYTDCEDLYLEEINPANPHEYKWLDTWLEAEVIAESIPVKGRPEPHLENVVVTRHGPLISGVVGFDKPLAVQSMALRPGPSLLGWLRLNQAAGWDDFVDAMRLVEAPQLNVAYADVEGNIGYWVTGRTPIRAAGDGSIPAPGWSGDYEWIGEVPFEQMPHALNPAQGYLVTCNHRIVDESFPYFLGNVWMNGYRARRIAEVLESKPLLGVDDFRLLHLDFTCAPGKEFVAALEDFSSSDPATNAALEVLRAWDGQLTPDAAGGAIYETVRYALVRRLLEPGLGKDLALRLMGQGFHPVLLPSHEFYGHDTVALLRLLRQPENWWLQQAGGKQALLEQAFKEALAWLKAHLGVDAKTCQWGQMHRAIFPHPLGIQKPLDRVFNRGPFPIGGDTDTPCQTAMNPANPYDNNSWAPSYRQIINMADIAASVAICPPGQSGQVSSPHYDDQIRPWLAGEYHPMLWTRQQVESHARRKLTLQ
jgi:penicillin amidase